MNKIKVPIYDLIPQMMESLNNNQIVELKVKGNSMSPFLKNDISVVGLTKYNNSLIKNRIYFYKYKDKYILHRYIKEKDDIYLFQGDVLYSYEVLKDDTTVIAYVEYVKTDNKQINPYSLSKMCKFRIHRLYKLTKKFIRKLVKPNA